MTYQESQVFFADCFTGCWCMDDMERQQGVHGSWNGAWLKLKLIIMVHFSSVCDLWSCKTQRWKLTEYVLVTSSPFARYETAVVGNFGVSGQGSLQHFWQSSLPGTVFFSDHGMMKSADTKRFIHRSRDLVRQRLWSYPILQHKGGLDSSTVLLPISPFFFFFSLSLKGDKRCRRSDIELVFQYDSI